MPLPDVPQGEYDAYTADRFTDQTTRRINSSLGGTDNFLQASGRRIAGLGVEPVEVASPSSPILRSQIAPPIFQPPALPPIPAPLPMPRPAPPQAPPAPIPAPPQMPGPIVQPTPPPAPPAGGIFAQPAQPEAVPTLRLPPATRPAGQVLPEVPLTPGPAATAAGPAARPVWATPPPTRAPLFADQQPPAAGAQGVDTSAPAMVAVNSNAPGEYQNYARQAAVRAGIDPSLFMAQIQQESGYNPSAGSAAGAQGIAQIVPRYHPGVDPNDPRASLDYAAGLMRRLLDQYQGDWQKALVAYNGGGGAVAAWDAGQPYGESQTYVARILGRGRPNQSTAAPAAADTTAAPSARPVATAMSTSQFGDAQLSASEAYAACGPAAAVRFAQAYGRNPTLKEALALAQEVGWTEQQGMAGIASEQHLMTKLGIPTRLVSGRNWDQFAQEAQGGNPVTISTPGHYFYADGYNPQTGAFHVGRSGLDLRRGKEWMTPAEMEGLMGTAQGALLANNPTISASSATVADQPSSLDDVRRQISASFGAAPPAPLSQSQLPPAAQPEDAQVRRLDRAVEMAYIPERPRRPLAEPASGDAATVLPSVMAAGAPPPPPPGGGPFDQLGRAIADAFRSAFGGGGPPGGGGNRNREEEERLRYGNRIQDPNVERGQLPEGPVEIPDIPLATPRTTAAAEIERFRHLGGNLDWPELPLPDLGLPETTPPRDIPEAIQRASTEALRRGLPSPGPSGQLGILDPKLGNPFENPEGAIPGLGDALEGLRGLRRASSVEREAAELAAREAPAITRAGVLRANVPDVGVPAAGRQRLPNYQPGTPEFKFEQIARPLRESSEDGLLHLDLNELPEDVLPLDPNVQTSSASGLVRTNKGGAPHTDDLRALFEANQTKRDFYYDQADQGIPTVGEPNLEEWFSANAISSMQTNVTGQVREALDVMGTVRQMARDGRAAGLSPEQIRANILDAVEKVGYSGPSLNNKRSAYVKGYTTGVADTGGPKTPTFAGNYGSAEGRVFDPGITSDVWNWRALNVSDEKVPAIRSGKPYVDTPHEKTAANNHILYRGTEAVFNELGSEFGIDGLAFQSAIWDGIRAMSEHDPAGYKMWQNGQFQDAIRHTRALGIFDRAIGKTGAPEPGEISRAMTRPSVVEALQKWGPVLKDPLPPELGIPTMTRAFLGDTSRGAPPIRPATAAFRAGERAIAESGAPIVRLGAISPDELDRLGVDQRGVLPWLATAHRLTEEAPGQYVVHLPAGNADTAHYVGATLGAALDREAVPLHIPDYRTTETIGIGFRGEPAQVAALQQALADAGYTSVKGTAGRSLQIPGDAANPAAMREIIDTVRNAGIDPAGLDRYRGVNRRLNRNDYGRTIGQLGSRFGPTTAGRRSLYERAIGPALAAEQEAASAAAARAVPGAASAAREPSTAEPGRESGTAGDISAATRDALADPQVGAPVADLLRGEPGRASPAFAVHAAGAASGGLLANAYTDPDDPNRTAKIAAGVAAGYAGARLATGIATRGAVSAGRGLSRSAPEQAWDAFVRRYSDGLVDLNHVQEDFQRMTGEKFTDEMKVAYLARVDPTNRALVASENAIGQAVRKVDRAGNFEALSKLVSLESDIATAEGLGTRVERQFLEGGIATSTERRMRDAQADLEAAQQAYGQAVADQRAIEAGNLRTRESMSAEAADRRVQAATDALDDATDAARQAQAASAAEAEAQGPAGRLVRTTEQRNLNIAESDVQRLNRRYDALHARDPEHPRLPRLARQIGYAEDRLSRLRTQMGETTVARETALGERAARAGEAAAARPTVSPTPELAAARVQLRYEARNLQRLRDAQARGEQGLVEQLARAQRRHGLAQRDVDVATADLPAAAAAQGQAQREGRIFEGDRRYPDLVRERDALHAEWAAKPEQFADIRKAADDIFDFRRVLLEEMIDSRLINRADADNLLRLYPKWTPSRMTDYMYDESPAGMSRGSRVNVSGPGFRSYTLEGYAGERENRIASLMREAYDVYARGAQNRTFNAFVDYLEMTRPPGRPAGVATAAEVFGEARARPGATVTGGTATGTVSARVGESGGTRRIASNMDEFQAAGGQGGSLLHPNYRPKVGQAESKITGMRDGVKQEWITDNPYLKAAVEMAPDSPMSGIMGKGYQKSAQIVTETATARNPKWLVKNVMRDASTYLIGTTAEGGVRGNLLPIASTYGPAMATYLSTDPDDPNRMQKALAAGAAGYLVRSAPGVRRAFGPNLLGEMLANYTDAFSGITRGTFTGPNTQEYLMRGGGMRGGTFNVRGIEGGQQLLKQITEPGGLGIRNAGDLGGLLKDAFTFGWVKAIGKRLELGPRVAAMRVAEQRGATRLEAMVRGRDVTLDFDRGGLWTKQVNRFVPFMNAQVQGGARFTRLARDEPAGLFLAGAALVGGPTLAAMQWNRADPQRSADYDNVPDYIKARGPVLMLPWVGTDKDGNRQPLHLDFDLQQFAPFAVAAQEVYDAKAGIPGRSPGDIAKSTAGTLLPGGSANPVDAATQILPVPFSTVAQLGLNRDLYRGSTIANQFSDERATALAKAVAPAVESAVTRIPGLETARIRPSQVDFLVRDILGGMGQTVTEAGNAVTGQPPRVPGAPSEAPLVGGLASGMLRTTGGQNFEDARSPEQMLRQDIRQQLRGLGDYYEPDVVPDTIQKIPLRQDEQAEFQRQTNEIFNERMARISQLPSFQNEASRARLIREAMVQSRDIAGQRVLAQIRQGGSSLLKRRSAESSAY